MAIQESPRTRSDSLSLRAFRTRGRPAVISGIGGYAPERILYNDDLADLGCRVDDEWIVKRTGIRSRHVADPGTAAFELAIPAAQRALEDAEVLPSELDMIICATTSPDGPFPAMACRVQDKIGAPGVMAFDVLAACSGFLYALAIAESQIASGRADTVLVVGAEVMTRFLDWKHHFVSILPGDGAGAAVVRAADGPGILSWCLGADGRGWDQITYGNVEKGAYAVGEFGSLEMKGTEVFKFAVDILPRLATAAADAAGIEVDDIDLWVPHQANSRIIEAAAERAGVPLSRMMMNLDRYANTSAASIPLALRDAVDQGRVTGGDKVLLAAFGAGLTWASCLVEWT